MKSWGNSLAVRIPSEVAKQAKLSEGTNVNFHVSEDGNIVLRPAYPAADDQEGLRALFLSLRGSSKSGIKAHEEEFVEPVGDEII
ncbi:AbrB/MazE/SpoVT family DNA-binding domain-containing protein [Paenibacillus lemnae]|uniref:AbrB/MazE/SpoVT family DNA-binding domain-containing protein n=1 Tax=Paenibacillus lemnae TaxID=1330551 RepID=A0A848M5P8_PAELE|nr:AbrB/MazE/SpoVT family DNA-binding domain-containing protein [Paenibacillus lemnae]